MLNSEQAERFRNLSPGRRRLLLERIKGQRISGEALVAEGMRQCGLKFLNGLPGTPICDVFKEASKRGIRILCPRHQQTGTLMAAAQNFIAGKVVHAICVSAGPAITNTVTGIMHARANNWPLLVLAGQRAQQGKGSGFFQELDAIPIMKSQTKWAATVTSASEIIPMIARACRVAGSGTPGPVYLAFPEDILSDFAQVEQVISESNEKPIQIAGGQLEDFIKLLDKSKRPLLCLGEGLMPHLDPDLILKFVEREELPFITTAMGRGILPDNHPLCFNKTRRPAMLQTDLFILAGAWFDWRLRRGSGYSSDTHFVHIHEDPDLLGKNVPEATCFNAKAMPFLGALSELRTEHKRPKRIEWVKAFGTMEVSIPNISESSDGSYASSTLAMQILNRAAPENAYYIAEASIHLSIAQHCIEVNNPFSWMDPGWHGVIGSGIPMALGMQLAFPERPVIAIVGDTSFGMAGMEMETAVRHKLPIKVIVMNNSGISGSIRNDETVPPEHPELFCQFNAGLKYDEIATSLGADGEAVSTNKELEPAIQRLIDSTRPYCLNIHVDPATPFPPIW